MVAINRAACEGNTWQPDIKGKHVLWNSSISQKYALWPDDSLKVHNYTLEKLTWSREACV